MNNSDSINIIENNNDLSQKLYNEEEFNPYKENYDHYENEKTYCEKNEPEKDGFIKNFITVFKYYYKRATFLLNIEENAFPNLKGDNFNSHIQFLNDITEEYKNKFRIDNKLEKLNEKLRLALMKEASNGKLDIEDFYRIDLEKHTINKDESIKELNKKIITKFELFDKSIILHNFQIKLENLFNVFFEFKIV